MSPAEVIVLDEHRPADAETWLRFRGGDRAAAGEVWRRESVWLRGVITRLLGPRGTSDVDDLAQDVFLIVQKKLPTIDLALPMRGYLVGVAVNVVRRRLRNDRRWAVLREHLPFGRAEAIGPSDPSAPRVVRELFEALEHLDPEERVAFSLRYVEQLSLDEVAAAMDVSLATAKRRLRSARLLLLAKADQFPALAARLDGSADDQ